jgi:hypothetical protein
MPQQNLGILAAFMKKCFSLLFAICIYCSYAHAQEAAFCDALSTIMNDAPNKFRNIRGDVVASGMNDIAWSCTIKVPGVYKSRFVSSMGYFYEGAFLQTKDTAYLKPIYDTCKAMLDHCLLPQGYQLFRSPNFESMLGAYSKLVYMLDSKDDNPAKAPPHVALEVLYNKDRSVYNITMYVFDH